MCRPIEHPSKGNDPRLARDIVGVVGMFTPINMWASRKNSAAQEACMDVVMLIKQLVHRLTRVRGLCPTSIDHGGYGGPCAT
jgi:hypothetical protein